MLSSSFRQFKVLVSLFCHIHAFGQRLARHVERGIAPDEASGEVVDADRLYFASLHIVDGNHCRVGEIHLREGRKVEGLAVRSASHDELPVAYRHLQVLYSDTSWPSVGHEYQIVVVVAPAIERCQHQPEYNQNGSFHN